MSLVKVIYVYRVSASDCLALKSVAAQTAEKARSLSLSTPWYSTWHQCLQIQVIRLVIFRLPTESDVLFLRTRCTLGARIYLSVVSKEKNTILRLLFTVQLSVLQ